MTDDTTRVFALLGDPVAHSLSPAMHNAAFRVLGLRAVYVPLRCAAADLPALIGALCRAGGGGNVTVPHKEAAFRAVAVRDPAAEAVGAVNTLWLENGRLVGGNSDVHGFVANLDERAPGWNVPGCRAVVLGAGGTGRAAVYALRQRGIQVDLVNRTIARAEDLARRFSPGVRAHAFGALPRLLPHADLLVNCTSLGLAGQAPLELDLAPLKPRAVVCDVIYLPLETALLVVARKRGHRTVDGLGMLLHQAGFGFRKWFGGDPQVTSELRALVAADIR